MTLLPFLTADLPGIGGEIKRDLEDFRVEEIPLYDACGRGTHAYFKVLKAGVPTPVAVDRIARYMGVRPMDIGVAGLKDSRALTTQTMSLEYADANKLGRFRDANIQVTDVSFHTNKLRIGHLAGNRFIIRIRGVGEAQLPAAQAVLDVLASRGVPNYFGEQRFGARGDTGLLGATMVRGDLKEFVRLFLGKPAAGDPPEARSARDAFDAGALDRALKLWPRHFVDQRKALTAFRRSGPRAALAAVDKRLKRLYVSAFQSEIFNEVLAARLGGIDRVIRGDLAMKTDSGGVFIVEDEAVEQPRAERFEISPTGPIVGPRCNIPLGAPGEIELAAINRHNVGGDDFARVYELKSKGGRRVLRFPLRAPQLSAGTDGSGSYIELAFTAPSGCYATVVLREIMKNEAVAEAAEAAEGQGME